MSSDNFATLTANSREMVHLPFVVGAIAVFHSVPGTATSTPIDLDACTLAKALSHVYSNYELEQILKLFLRLFFETFPKPFLKNPKILLSK